MSDSTSATALAFYCASVLSLIFALTITLKRKKINAGKSFCFAAFVNAAWLFAVAYYSPGHDTSIGLSRVMLMIGDIEWLLVSEILHYCAWLFALTKTAQRNCPNCIPRRLRYILYSCSVILPATALFSTQTQYAGVHALKILAWSGILLSILCLLVLEQLYRNMNHNRLMRLIWLALAVNFLFDAFLFSQNLIVLSLNIQLWQIRASVTLVTFTLMTVGVIAMQAGSQRKAHITFSQPAIFYTTSLGVTGIVLIILSIGGYYVRLHQASWASVFYYTALAVGVVSICVLFSSEKVRRKVNVNLNKHLFNYKYDYRAEWLSLIRLLSQPGEHHEYTLRALSASAALFRCEQGMLWQKKGTVHTATARLNVDQNIVLKDEPTSSPFSKSLKSGWIFSTNPEDPEMQRNNELIPAWIRALPDTWIIFPLLIEDDASGFIILSKPSETDSPNWEDFDLAKTVGRQVANHIARHEQSELLAQAKQFETFNKLSAFVMHDLKNLIAQQSLVVKNAEKHKDNPAFVEDAINTINNSVGRMNNLLRKLRQNEPEETKVLQVKELLIEAVRRCQKTPPAPSLMRVDPDIHVKADFDSLVMVFTHIIANSQDATPETGFIDIYLEVDNNFANICIEDDGEGMDEDFIRDKLFQPFESTKSGKGMGVGVYQAREYIENLGGDVTVVSKLGQGTKFTLSIPVAQA